MGYIYFFFLNARAGDMAAKDHLEEMYPLHWSLFNLWLLSISFIPFCPPVENFVS